MSDWEQRAHPSSRQAPGSHGHCPRLPNHPTAHSHSLPVSKRKGQGHGFSFGPSRGERVCLTVPHGITFTHHGNVCSRPHAHRRQGATCLSETKCQQRFLVPAASVHPRDSLHEHVLLSRFAMAMLRVLAPAASHTLRSPSLAHVCRSWVVILPI